MASHGAAGDVDLYEVLGIRRDASKSEIKKAYHKAALQHHPDKAPEDQRDEADVRFKAISQAYEILSDEQKREMYDVHGMAAFDGSRGSGMGPEMDFADIFSMFGGGLGGHRFGPGGGAHGHPRRGPDEEQKYTVTLEELYKGKTVKFASTKNIICAHCKGTGGKEKAKAQTCERCKGQGMTIGLRQIGPGLVTQERILCENCSGKGMVFREKDRCKKCKGKRITSEKKVLEIYIPRGARMGEKIVLEGEADQVPDQTPGDIIFTLEEEDHEVFQRAGDDLAAELHITLAESLTGFSRVVLKHLDGRGLHITHPAGKVMRPGQVLKIPGEGMPIKRSDAKGDLFLNVNVDFPEDGWLGDDETQVARLKDLLPKEVPIVESSEEVDEVQYDGDADIDDFGANSGDPRAHGGWEDEDEDDGGGPTQCTQQ